MLICPKCGSHVESQSGKYYACAGRRRQGTCDNKVLIPIKDMDGAVLRALEDSVLSPRAIESLLASIEAAPEDERKRLEAERASLSTRSWLFHHRWGRQEGARTARGERLIHVTIDGRTTAFAPSRQR